MQNNPQQHHLQIAFSDLFCNIAKAEPGKGKQRIQLNL
jgi:hypothetical protein